MAPSGVIAHSRSRPALEPIRAETVKWRGGRARDCWINVLGLWFFVPQVALASLVPAVGSDETVIVLTLRDALQCESYERCLSDAGSSDQLEDPEDCWDSPL